MRIRRILIFTGVVLLSAMLAFRLNGIVYAMIVLPAAYLLWLLKLLYLALPRLIWWSLLILAVLYILITSLLQGIRLPGRARPPLRPSRGNVENLAAWAERSKKGTYFKWLIANRLGRIAHQILQNRTAGKRRSFFDPLMAPDWTPAPGVQAYLEAGLQGSFADFPRNNPLRRTSPATPLDHDIIEVIEYLETQVDEARNEPSATAVNGE
ncbi:MAG: hypothetical protein HXY42_11330 [Chloroflexi bacterium]|nr:hypothetical protein [Chloroflexota bacterium]